MLQRKPKKKQFSALVFFICMHSGTPLPCQHEQDSTVFISKTSLQRDRVVPLNELTENFQRLSYLHVLPHWVNQCFPSSSFLCFNFPCSLSPTPSLSPPLNFSLHPHILTKCSLLPSSQCVQPRPSFSPFCTHTRLSPSQFTVVC